MVHTEKIRIADYLFNILAEEYGVDTVFMISGGGAMFLNEAVGQMHDAGKLQYVCNHHEQAGAIAAEGYSRASNGRLGVVCVTTGPGGLNTLTGVHGQWTDSVPVLYLSGQVKRTTTLGHAEVRGLRQLGDQEVDIVSVVRPITKYAAAVTDPLEAGQMLEQAVHAAQSDRPGPAWLDVPIDVQAFEADVGQLEELRLRTRKELELRSKKSALVLESSARTGALASWNKLTEAKRPVIVAGRGVRLAGAREKLLELAEKLPIPILGTFNAVDLMPSDHSCFAGRIGTVGTRSGNFVLQNSDLVLTLGTRNNIRQVSYNWQLFARSAFVIGVDIDPAELLKPTLTPDLPIHADAGDFLSNVLALAEQESSQPDFSNWLAWCRERKTRYPVVGDTARGQAEIDPYLFMQELTTMLSGADVVAAGNGTACTALHQAAVSKSGSTIFSNSGCAAMGYDLPAAIGAWFALHEGDRATRRICCLAGDGSLMMNIQELATIVRHRIPLKIFVLNNGGYSSIRQTQETMFAGHAVASGPSSGISFPDFRKVAEAFGLRSARMAGTSSIVPVLSDVLNDGGPVLIEVVLDPDSHFSPKVTSSRNSAGAIVTKPLEDMWPQLEAALTHMRVHGRVPICGMIAHYNDSRADMTPGPRNLTETIYKLITLRGFVVSEHEHMREQFEQDMAQWIASGQVKYHETIAQGIENAADAFIGLFSGSNTGKMLVKLADE